MTASVTNRPAYIYVTHNRGRVGGKSTPPQLRLVFSPN